MSEPTPAHIARTAELIEQLLADAELRHRFRTDPAGVLTGAGLPELAAALGPGNRALLTLELRESRSSLAGALVAAAAEGLDLAQLADHAAPALAHDADHAVERVLSPPHHHPVPHHTPTERATPPAPNLGPQATTPPLARAAPAHPAAAAAPDQPVAQATDPHAGAAAKPASGTVPDAQQARMTSASTAGPDNAGSSGSPASAPHTASGGAAVSPGNQPGPGSASAAQPASGSASAAQPASGSSAAHSSPGAAPVSAPHQSATGSAANPGSPSHPAQTTTPSPADSAAGAVDPSEPGLAYPGDQASPQAIAAWMGAAAQRAGLPPELPVMAALTESGLHNLSYGDRDSVGFFQMRVGIWNQGAYAGYPDHPELQLQWFIDHALAARQQDPALSQSPDSWGEWVANVEQPAAQYRYRYQLQLGAAQQLLHGAELAPAAGAPVPVPAGQAALDAALHLVDHAPAHGGAVLQGGADPAQLVQYAYARQDVQLPGAAAEQYDVGIPVARDHLRPGDAVFFAQPGGAIDRVGLYAGHGKLVAAARSGGDVQTHALDDPGLGEYVGARRYTAQALGNPTSYARPLPTVKP